MWGFERILVFWMLGFCCCLCLLLWCLVMVRLCCSVISVDCCLFLMVWVKMLCLCSCGLVVLKLCCML